MNDRLRALLKRDLGRPYHAPVDDNPAIMLRVLLDMTRLPDRATYGWDQDVLAWMAATWNQAAIANCGDLEFLHWRNFYQHWSESLKAGDMEHGSGGIVWFNRADEWPPRRCIVRALAAILHADMDVPGVVPKPSRHRRPNRRQVRSHVQAGARSIVRPTSPGTARATSSSPMVTTTRAS